MRKTFFKLSLTLLACPLLAVMAISGAVLGKEVTADKGSTISPEEVEIQEERMVGRLWLIALPHLTPEEKDSVAKYLQAGIQRDFDYERALKKGVEKNKNTPLNNSVDRSEDVPATTQKEAN